MTYFCFHLQEKEKINPIKIFIVKKYYCYNLNSSLIESIALTASSANSGSGIPIFSHSKIFSRFTDAAKAFCFIRLVTDFVFTLASFLSG